MESTMEAKRSTHQPQEYGGREATRVSERSSEDASEQGARRFENAVLVVNTRSRVGHSATAPALDHLRLLGVPLKAAYALEDASRLAETVRGALEEGHDLIVVGGGDGSVSSIAGVLAGSGAVLGVLPLGTANDFARTLGMPDELGKACTTVADGMVASVDLSLAGDHHYVNVASMGLGSAVAEAQSPRLKRAVGALAYPFATVRAYLEREPFEAGFAFPDGDHEAVTIRDLIHVAVGNGRYYGGGLVVAPGSGIEDHTLDVYAVQAAAAPDLARIAWRLRTGDFVDDGCVHCWRTRRARILTKPRLPISLDGELVCHTPKSFSVVPGCLKVLIPQTHGRHAHAAAALASVANG
jgi:diacylglycerol kinase (ATP)